MIGYEDALSPTEHGEHAWAAPDVLQFLLRAEEDPAHPYVLILDEMNLAHVERYFADFLSGIESRQPILPNLTRSAAGDWRITLGGAQQIRSQPMSSLWALSTWTRRRTSSRPKVLDRANSFEFRVRTDDLGTVGSLPSAASEGNELDLRQVLAVVSDDDWHVRSPHPRQSDLVEGPTWTSPPARCHRPRVRPPGLRRRGARFAALFSSLWGGRRPHRVGSLHNAEGSSAPSWRATTARAGAAGGVCCDGPRRRSPAELEPSALTEQPALPTTLGKVGRMLESLRVNQFVSFAE